MWLFIFLNPYDVHQFHVVKGVVKYLLTVLLAATTRFPCCVFAGKILYSRNASSNIKRFHLTIIGGRLTNFGGDLGWTVILSSEGSGRGEGVVILHVASPKILKSQIYKQTRKLRCKRLLLLFSIWRQGFPLVSDTLDHFSSL